MSGHAYHKVLHVVGTSLFCPRCMDVDDWALWLASAKRAQISVNSYCMDCDPTYKRLMQCRGLCEPRPFHACPDGVE
jgi:hypothetical protein